MINDEELRKCEDLVAAIAAREAASDVYPPDIPAYSELPELSCVQV